MCFLSLALLLLSALPLHAASVRLAWDYPPPGTAAGTFVVQRQLGDDAWHDLTTLPLHAGTQTWTDDTLPSPGPYVAAYRVVAKTPTATSDPSNQLTVTGGGQPRLAQTSLRVEAVDSEETRSEDGKGSNAVDGTPDTLWHTAWSTQPTPPPPHWITLDLGEPMRIDGLSYLPRIGGQQRHHRPL
jgi:hypothetical protein